MEYLAGKVLRNSEAMFELEHLYEDYVVRQAEVQSILDFVDANPDVFEISEDEAIMDDVGRALEDITNKIVNEEIIENVRRFIN